MPVLKSEKRHAVAVGVVTASFTGDLDRLPCLYVEVRNRGNGTIDFSTANISAKSGETNVHVFTYEELKKKIEFQAGMQAFAAALNGASQSFAAAMPQTTYAYGSATAYGSGGAYAHATYSGTATTYNPAASAAAQAAITSNTSLQMSSIAASRNARVGDLSSMLRRNTVGPGQSAGGTVKLRAGDLKKGKPLTVVVNISGESHQFLFDVGQ